MKKLSFLNVVGLDLISLSFYLSFFALSCFCCPSLKIIVEHVNSTILFSCLFFLVFLFFSFFFFFSVLRSESFEMLVPIKPPIEERSTKEELKTLSVKLFSLVSGLQFLKNASFPQASHFCSVCGGLAI